MLEEACNTWIAALLITGICGGIGAKIHDEGFWAGFFVCGVSGFVVGIIVALAITAIIGGIFPTIASGDKGQCLFCGHILGMWIVALIGLLWKDDGEPGPPYDPYEETIKSGEWRD